MSASEELERQTERNETMILLKIALIMFIVIVILFLLSLLIYFRNLDMKLAAKMIPLMNKIYDKRKRNKRI